MVTKGPLTSNYDYMIYFTSSGTNWDFYKKTTEGVGSRAGGFSTSYSHFNRWNHVCFTITSSGLVKSYENSIVRNEESFSNTNIRKSSQSLKIGRGWGSTFNGLIGKVRIYNRDLTDSEIKQNFNAQKHLFGV